MTEKKGISLETIIRDIKRKTQRKFTAEEKIRIILEGLRGESAISDLCRREGVHPTMCYKWSKAFLEAGKRQMTGDTVREAGTDEVNELRKENGGMRVNQAKSLKEPDQENARLGKECFYFTRLIT